MDLGSSECWCVVPGLGSAVFLSCEPAQVLYLFMCMGFALTLWLILSFYQPLCSGCRCELQPHIRATKIPLDTAWLCTVLSCYSVELSRSGRESLQFWSRLQR